MTQALVHSLERLEAILTSGSACAVGGTISVVDVAYASDVAPLLLSVGVREALVAKVPKVVAHVESIARTPWFNSAAVAQTASPAVTASGGTKRDAAGAPVSRAGGTAEAKVAKEPKVAKGSAATAAAASADLLALLPPLPVPGGLPPPVASLDVPILHAIRDIFTAAIATAYAAAFEASPPLPPLVADIAPNFNPAFGHQYQVNSALSLVAKLKGRPGAPANPRAAADAIVTAVTKVQLPAFVGKLDVSGPGYINVYESGEYLAARVGAILSRGVTLAPPAVKRIVALDYSSPNIAKEMHIGHLRSTIIGDALGRTLELAGHVVHRINHVGDWGTQFGMLIAALKDEEAAAAASGAGGTPASLRSLGDLTALYKAAKKRFDAEPDFKERAHHEVVALQVSTLDTRIRPRRESRYRVHLPQCELSR